jgi:hypothetical protein
MPPPAPPAENCRVRAEYYVIYMYAPLYVELLRWDFTYRWCWDATNVTQVTVEHRPTVIAPVMQLERGALTMSIGPRPAPNVTTRWDGLEAAYCPVGACIAYFHPMFEYDYRRNGNWVSGPYRLG